MINISRCSDASHQLKINQEILLQIDFKIVINQYQKAMTEIENLHYAIGELAYAVAHADGKVQKEERKIFHDIVNAELRCKDYAFEVSDIIFQIINKDNTDSETAYKWAMDQIRLYRRYLSPELKKTFIRVIEKVARAFPPVTSPEQSFIDRFKKDMEGIKGDPIFYRKALV